MIMYDMQAEGSTGYVTSPRSLFPFCGHGDKCGPRCCEMDFFKGQEMRKGDAIMEGKLFHVISPIMDPFSGVNCIHNLDDVLVQQEPIKGDIRNNFQVACTQHLSEKMVIISQCISHFTWSTRANNLMTEQLILLWSKCVVDSFQNE